MNLMQIFSMIMGSKNPMQIFKNLAMSNPVANRVMQMSNGKSPEQIKQVCQNLCQQRGISFEDAYNEFNNNFGGMF